MIIGFRMHGLSNLVLLVWVRATCFDILDPP